MTLPAPTWRWRAASVTGVADGASLGTSTVPGTGAVTTALHQPTVAKRPVWRNGANGINGQPVFQFDAVDDALVSTATITRPATGTWMVVGTVAPGTVGGTFGQGFHMPSMEMYGEPQAIGLYTSAGISFVDAATPAGGNHVLTGVFNGASSNIRLDGTVMASGNLPAAAAGAATITVGSHVTEPRSWNGKYAEIIGWNRVLTPAELADAHSYVQDTYGIAVSDYVSSGTTPVAVSRATSWAVAAPPVVSSLAISNTGPPLSSTTAEVTTRTTDVFTPPAGSVLVALVSYHNSQSGTGVNQTVTSSTGLTWTRLARKSRDASSTGGATGGDTGVEIWHASVPTQTAMTVTATSASASARALRVMVVTGAEATPGGAVAASYIASGTFSASLVTTRAGSLVFAAGADWQETGAGNPNTTYGAGQQSIDTVNLAGWYTARNWRTTNPVATSGSTVSMTQGTTGQQASLAIAEVRLTSGSPPPLVTVAVSRATSWNVAAVSAEPGYYSDTYSDVYGAAPTPVPLTTVSVSRATSWSVAAAADYYSDLYSDVYGAAAVPATTKVAVTRTTSWETIGPVAVSRSTAWVSARAITAPRATTWSTWQGPVGATRSTSWAVFGLALPTTAIATPGMRLRVFLPNGADQGYLPTPESGNVAYPLNDVGALTFSYALRAPRAALLGQPVEVAVEVTPDGGFTWSEPPNSRFVYVTDGADPLDQANKYSVQCKSFVWRLSKSVVLPNNLLNADGKRSFLSGNVGVILKTLFTEAQTRGSMTGISHASFSTTADSAGQAWNTTLTKYYEPGINYLAVLQDLADSGLCDYKMQGRSLFVYNADTTLAVDRTVGASQVTFQAGRDLTDAPFTRTWEGLANYAYFAGEGVNYEYNNPSAITPWGRQEIFISNGSVSDPGTMAVLTQNELAQHDVERVQYTRGLDFTRAVHRPFAEYGVGDYVWSRSDGQAPARLRIRQLTLSVNAQGILSGSVVLNDRFLESDVRAKRRVDGITNGAQSGNGTGTPPSDNPDGSADTKAPAQVTGVGGSSAAFMGPGGFPQAQATLTWGAVSTNVDGTPIIDFDHYELWRRPFGTVAPHTTDPQQPGGSQMYASTIQTVHDSSPYVTGSSWWFHVVAVDKSGNRSVRSAEAPIGMATDNTPPQAPTAPVMTARLGIVSIFWDGLMATGTMPPDFDFVEVHVSTVNNFTPTTATLFDQLNGEGSAVYTTGAYGVPLYAKLVAVDKTPLKGPASVQATATPVQLVNTDLITNIVDARLLGDDAVDTAAIADLAVGTANIKDAAIVSAKIGSLAVNDANIASINVGKLSAGTLNAEVLVANRLTTSMAGSRVQMDSTGIRMYQDNVMTVHMDPTPGRIQINNTTDASHNSTGHGIQFGPTNSHNIIIDDNEMMARFNGTYGVLSFNREGGRVILGGKLGGFPTVAQEGIIPQTENHQVRVDSALYIRNRMAGDYTQEYPPLMVGHHGGQHLWMDQSSIGAVASGDFVDTLYINPRYADGTNSFINPNVVLASNSIAMRRIGDNNAAIRGWTGINSAVQFIDNEVRITNGETTAWAVVKASAFTVSSARSVKDNITDFDPVVILQGSPSKRWTYKEGVATDQRPRFGPMVDDLPADLVDESSDGVKGYDLGSLVGVHHEALRVILDRLEELESRGPQR